MLMNGPIISASKEKSNSLSDKTLTVCLPNYAWRQQCFIGDNTLCFIHGESGFSYAMSFGNLAMKSS